MSGSETFSIDQITEPEDLQSVIYSMVAIPHLSPENIFNDFSAPVPDSRDKEKEDLSEAGIFQIDGESKLYSLVIYADNRRLAVDPFVASQIIVAKAVRKLVCFGIEPMGLSAFLNNVNIGNPLAQELVIASRLGLEAAASAFNLQISHRKINYEYSNDNGSNPPTLIISLVGKLQSREKILNPKLKKKGHNILLIGRTYNDINASEYLDHYHDIKNWPLMHFNLASECRLMNTMKELIQKDLVVSAAPVGAGGLFFTLLRSALPNELGFDITTDAEIRTDAFLFGEGMGRVVVTVTDEKEDAFVDFLVSRQIPVITLGHVTRGEIRIDDQSFGFVDKGITSEIEA